MFTIFCDLIGCILNNVSDLIGAKTTKGKECCLNVSSRLWGGALRDDTKNGCEGDYHTASRFSFLVRAVSVVECLNELYGDTSQHNNEFIIITF